MTAAVIYAAGVRLLFWLLLPLLASVLLLAYAFGLLPRLVSR